MSTGLPHAETAARMGLTEGAVAKRLERGKLRPRRVLTTELMHKSAAHGSSPSAEQWRETRIWCFMCGQRRTMARLVRDTGEFTLRCPDCRLLLRGHTTKAAPAAA